MGIATGKTARLAIAAVFALTLLAACDGGSAQGGSASATASGAGAVASAAAQSAGAQASRDPEVRAEIESILAAVRDNAYDSVTFAMETKTSATGNEKGRIVQQNVLTTMDGELTLSKDDTSMHFAYKTSSTARPNSIAYDMYINKDNVFVKQDGKLYLTDEKDVKPENYTKVVTDIASEDEVKKLLDVASSYKVEHGDDTVITITANGDKLAESNLVDLTSLPEDVTIATMVTNYVVSPDNRFKTVRVMSSTSGTPTYRVNQTYNFSKYNETKLPDWPSLADQIAQDPRVQKDADGNMYLTDDAGNRYLIESIDPDGTVHYSGGPQDAAGGTDTGDTGGYYYGGGSGGGGGGTGGGGGSNNGGGGGGAAPAETPAPTGGGSTGMGNPTISDDNAGGGGKDTGMGEPIIYDDGK